MMNTDEINPRGEKPIKEQARQAIGDASEEVKAVVQLRAGLAASPEISAALQDACRTALASFKCPRSIDFDPTLPREPTGKLRKQLIRQRYL